MHPNLILNYPAMAVAVLAAFIFGFLWYGPILGRTWAGLMGFDTNQKPDMSKMRKSLGLQLLGTVLVVYVLAHSVQIWRPSVWNAGADGDCCMYGVMCGFFTWVGFYIPQQLGKVAWEGRPWKLFLINIGHDFINLQIISLILACWR